MFQQGVYRRTDRAPRSVAMAESALSNVKHQEIKDMANAIISAQTSEINQMRE